MKQKDVVYALLAVVILMGAGYLAYTKLMPKNATQSEGTKVEVVGLIPASLDEGGLSDINDPARTINYNPPYDLTGLNNSAPFGK